MKTLIVSQPGEGYFKVGDYRPPTEEETKKFTEIVMSLPDQIKAMWVGWGGESEYSRFEETPTCNLALKTGAGGESFADSVMLDPTYLDHYATGGGSVAVHEYIHVLCNQPTISSRLDRLYNPGVLFSHAQRAQDKLSEDMTMMLTCLWDASNARSGRHYSSAFVEEMSKMSLEDAWKADIVKMYSYENITPDIANMKVFEVTQFMKEIGLW